MKGMPTSAIETGCIDQVLPIAAMAEALRLYELRGGRSANQSGKGSEHLSPVSLAGIVELLRDKTTHDFTLYKHGTLQRRIERRMGLLGLEAGEALRYLAILQKDDSELAQTGP